MLLELVVSRADGRRRVRPSPPSPSPDPSPGHIFSRGQVTGIGTGCQLNGIIRIIIGTMILSAARVAVSCERAE